MEKEENLHNEPIYEKYWYFSILLYGLILKVSYNVWIHNTISGKIWGSMYFYERLTEGNFFWNEIRAFFNIWSYNYGELSSMVIYPLLIFLIIFFLNKFYLRKDSNKKNFSIIFIVFSAQLALLMILTILSEAISGSHINHPIKNITLTIHYILPLIIILFIKHTSQVSKEKIFVLALTTYISLFVISFIFLLIGLPHYLAGLG